MDRAAKLGSELTNHLFWGKIVLKMCKIQPLCSYFFLTVTLAKHDVSIFVELFFSFHFQASTESVHLNRLVFVGKQPVYVCTFKAMRDPCLVV